MLLWDSCGSACGGIAACHTGENPRLGTEVCRSFAHSRVHRYIELLACGGAACSGSACGGGGFGSGGVEEVGDVEAKGVAGECVEDSK